MKRLRRKRSELVHPARRSRRAAPAERCSAEEAREIVGRAYREVLLREPDRDAAGYVRSVAASCADGEAVAAELRRNREYLELVAPAAEAVRRAYRLLFDRDPTAAEAAERVAALRHRIGDDARILAAGAFDHLLDVRPLTVEMDITNQCNIRCVMCYFSDPLVGRRRREDLTLAQYERIAEQVFPWVQRLSLTLGTEPLIHPQFLGFVRIAKRLGVPKVYVNTNGVLMTPAMGAGMLDAGLDAVTVSLDAGTAATYERVRRGARWHTVIDNIAALQRSKDARGSARPALALSFVMMRSTVDELPAFVRLAAELRIPAVHLMHVVSYANLQNERESLVHEPARGNALVAQARALGRELGVQVLSPANLAEQTAGAPAATPHDLPRARDYFDLALGRDDGPRGCCPFPWHFLGIDFGGDVKPCGWWFEGGPMGNLLRQDFAAIWQGPALQRLRASLQHGELAPDCRTCPAAGMGSAARDASFGVRQPLLQARRQP